MKQKKLRWPWILLPIMFLGVGLLGLKRNRTSQDAVSRLQLGQDVLTVGKILEESRENYTEGTLPDGETIFEFGGGNFLENLLTAQTYYQVRVDSETGLTLVSSETYDISDNYGYKVILAQSPAKKSSLDNGD